MAMAAAQMVGKERSKRASNPMESIWALILEQKRDRARRRGRAQMAMAPPHRHHCLAAIIVFLVAASSSSSSLVSSASSFAPRDRYLIDCGSSGSSTDGDGFVWVGDAKGSNGSSFLTSSPSQDQEILASTIAQNPNLPSSTPFLTARIFTSPSSYSFPVSPGRHWLRLYFYPFPFQSFDPSNAIVSVKLDNSYNLISNLSLQHEISSLNLAYVYREFTLNVSSSFLTLTISPGSSPNSFAMLNGLQLVSMPDDMYKDSLIDIEIGQNTPISFPLHSSALQTMYRLNVGGQPISPSQDDLNRAWMNDLAFIPGAATGVADSAPPNTVIDYGSLDNYTAPQEVYDTARFMTNDNNVNLGFNLTWNFSVDPNFTYYIRLHFCEIAYSKQNMRVFDIYINRQTAFAAYDVVLVTSGEYRATVLDFAATLQGADSSITVEMHPSKAASPQYYNAILNGLEIFKMNDSTGNLQGPPPPALPQNTVPGTTMASPPSTVSNKMAIVGGVAGSVAALAALAVIFFCFCRARGKKGDGGRSPGWLPLPLHGGNSQSMVSKLSTTSRKSGTGSYVSSTPTNLCRYFTFAEILEMTKNFDESWVLGVGGFGKVYKGVLEDGTIVAVKRGNPCSEQGVTEFQTEIELLSKLRHRHLVSLIGFCEEHSEMILVYDYMSNGPLRGHLYGTDLPSLSWKQRLDICIGAARGLHYLHTGAAQGIIHRDVKTTNILLDENLVAKVSDFGLSKTGPTLEHTHVSTAVKGSFGYLDPEYFRRQQLTEKSDVYSFGVVLMEVLCARPAINPTLPREQVNMAEWAMHWQKKGMLDQIIDPYLVGRISKESLRKFGETAEKCLAECGPDRPAMGDILWNLEYALQLHETSEEKELDGSSMPEVKEIPLNFNESAVKMEDSLGSHSAGSRSLFSEDSDDATPSAVFSQLVNPQGR